MSHADLTDYAMSRSMHGMSEPLDFVGSDVARSEVALAQRGREAIRAISEIGWGLRVLAPGREPGPDFSEEEDGDASAATIASYAVVALRERDKLRNLLRRVHVAAFGTGGFIGSEGKLTFGDAVEYFEAAVRSKAATLTQSATAAERAALDEIAHVLGVRAESPERLVDEVRALVGAAGRAGSKLFRAESMGWPPNNPDVAGRCLYCGGPVLYRPGHPGEYDHSCQEPVALGGLEVAAEAPSDATLHCPHDDLGDRR